jgi:hypothetical protein
MLPSCIWLGFCNHCRHEHAMLFCLYVMHNFILICECVYKYYVDQSGKKLCFAVNYVRESSYKNNKCCSTMLYVTVQSTEITWTCLITEFLIMRLTFQCRVGAWLLGHCVSKDRHKTVLDMWTRMVNICFTGGIHASVLIWEGYHKYMGRSNVDTGPIEVTDVHYIFRVLLNIFLQCLHS